MASIPCRAPTRCLRPLNHTITQGSNTSNTLASVRSLSTTPILPRQKPSFLTVPPEQVPDYPYGRYTTYKQRNAGLYGAAKVRFGNTIAPKYNRKSPHKWYPNRQTKRLWSLALQAFVRTRLTTQTLKTVDKLGGIDEYLLGNKTRRIRDLGPAGWKLRWKVMQTDAVRERFNREREAMGLPRKDYATGVATELPAELLAEGLTAESVEEEVGGMIERDEEFVIGEIMEGEEVADAATEDARLAAEEADLLDAEQAKAVEKEQRI
ncbi:hypothetical protein F5Y15DRAFT_367400 [Xylariaceae sp. FL0016]|nr:hypothetical protein F5Y15DRAFT_367400 [Xylariaceae sp. FL0016]